MSRIHESSWFRVGFTGGGEERRLQNVCYSHSSAAVDRRRAYLSTWKSLSLTAGSGVRLPKTYSDPEIWYAANKVLGKTSSSQGPIFVLTLAVLLLSQQVPSLQTTKVNTGILLVALAGPSSTPIYPSPGCNWGGRSFAEHAPRELKAGLIPVRVVGMGLYIVGLKNDARFNPLGQRGYQILGEN